MERLLEAVMARAGHVGRISDLQRLSGGANMESWAFACGGGRFVLRRAPSAEWIAARPLGMDGEAELIRQAHAAGVRAPEVVAELVPSDGLGIGFVMGCLPGTADPEVALSSPPQLASDLATAMAGIHALAPDKLTFLPKLDPAQGVEGLARQFEEAGGDRPAIALGLAWLRSNLPPPAPPVVVHGDFRIGNLMVHEGRLSGVLDWELAHLGDGHEDLAYGCMTVWRFGRLDRQGFGLTDVDTLARAYQDAGGEPFDPARFRFWLVYRTVWWALGCLSMGQSWRSGTDRSLERVVVARRCAEQELDLLLLLEYEAPEAERQRPVPSTSQPARESKGEPEAAEILTAVSEWLAATVKDKLSGRERWELAVAQNALGIVRRELAGRADPADKALAEDILAGRQSLRTEGLLATLRARTLSTLSADMPKYPALGPARALWSQA
ncbi:phosphotransferase [Novosphingobium jiangmenense]|uniref:Phosphotransferase family protein n=1 Tax=Novosphingobium jiangmenense TaxID=2791981 RepID=A0ABS0HG78_9SPHN|nr:phosphotransferase [Novosphingobium jiangmenense]MBF9151262.1 phosphotransferase family protein [Novosphingobium jiangmenense]